VGIALLDLCVLLMAVASLRQSLRSHRERAVATAQNLVQVLDHYVGDTIGKADLALWVVKDEVERGGTPRDLDGFLRRQHGRVPGLVALRTTDAEGRVNHGSGEGAGRVVDLADRAHFVQLRDNPDAGLVISKPLLGRLTGTWVIVAARRLEGPGHRFAGMVLAVISLDQFQRAFSALDVGPHGSVALRDLDLGLIARYPEAGSAGTAVGQKVVSQAFRDFAKSGQRVGIYRTTTPFDQVQRTFAIRRVEGLPYFILVGVADRDYLAGWRWEVAQESLEVALIWGLTLVGFALIRRTWLRQQGVRVELERLLAEVKTLGGMLPICSHCKKIRDDRGYWNQIEAYLNEHTDAEFTHGICPDCAREVFPRTSGKNTVI
jgi:hypothetical protein